MRMIRRPFYLMLTFLCLTASCQRHNVDSGFEAELSKSKIINGEPVAKEDPVYTRTVRILELSDGVWYPRCTGTIIARDLVLTAAHCVQYTNIEFLRVGFDVQPLSIDLQRSPETRVDVPAKFRTITLIDLMVHPEYRADQTGHDMAVLRLTTEIPNDPAIATVAPLLSDEMFSKLEKVQQPLILAGYGIVSELPEIGSEILRRTQVSGRFEGLHIITDQTKGSGGCIGDSGGPAYLKIDDELYLVGVTEGSAGGSEDCHHEGLLGNISLEKKFLNEAAARLQSATRF